MRNTIKSFFVVNPYTTPVSFPFLAVIKYHFIDHKLVFETILLEKDNFVPGVNIWLNWCQKFVGCQKTSDRSLVFRVFCVFFTSKYVSPLRIHSGVFSVFCIISLSKLVNVTGNNGRYFSRWFSYLKLGRCCLRFIYGYFFPFLLIYFLIFFLRIPYQLADILKIFILPISLSGTFLYCPYMVFLFH